MTDELDLYRLMYLVRRFDQEAEKAYGRGEIHGTYRTGRGQEAVSVGVCAVLEPGDQMHPSLRGVQEILAHGTAPHRVMAELFGKASGVCGGRGGALHVADVPRGAMGLFGVLSASTPIATGGALAARLRGDRSVSVCFFGDQATNEGVFHECLNIASLWRLPLLFVGINNAPEDAQHPLGEHTAAGSLAALAEAHRISSSVVDATDVLRVHHAAQDAVLALRSGEGPRFLECRCFPLGELSRAETEEALERMRSEGRYVGFLSYKKSLIGKREPATPAAWRRGDPLTRSRTRLVEGGQADEATLRAREAEVDAVLASAVQFARDAAQPEPGSAVTGVFAG